MPAAGAVEQNNNLSLAATLHASLITNQVTNNNSNNNSSSPSPVQTAADAWRVVRSKAWHDVIARRRDVGDQGGRLLFHLFQNIRLPPKFAIFAFFPSLFVFFSCVRADTPAQRGFKGVFSSFLYFCSRCVLLCSFPLYIIIFVRLVRSFFFP